MKEQCKRMQDRTDEIHKLTENLKKQAEVATLEKEEEEWPEASSRYSQALEALVDPLLPVRGHGLIEMTKLVAEKDAEVMANIKKVVGLFKVLNHNDLSFLLNKSCKFYYIRRTTWKTTTHTSTCRP